MYEKFKKELQMYLLKRQIINIYVFDGKEVPYVSKFYDYTISCYSFSKSLYTGEFFCYTILASSKKQYAPVAQLDRVSDSDVSGPSS